MAQDAISSAESRHCTPLEHVQAHCDLNSTVMISPVDLFTDGMQPVAALSPLNVQRVAAISETSQDDSPTNRIVENAFHTPDTVQRIPVTPKSTRSKTRSRLPKPKRHDSLLDTKVLLATRLKRTSSVNEPELFQFAEHFEFLSLLGQTQHSEVYKVRHRHTGELYAIKRCRRPIQSRTDRERCLHEIQAVSALPPHPHIVGHYRAWQQDSHFYIQMDICEGGSLAALSHKAWQAGRPLPEEQLWAVMQQLAQGLQLLHEHSILHLDVKPDNLLADRPTTNGQGVCWRLGDFGLAVVKQQWEWEEGDGRYVAPELLACDAQPSSAADIYSMGATLYECATGHVVPRTAEARNTGSVQLPHHSASFQWLLQQMLCPDPAQRPSATQLLQQIQQLHGIMQPPAPVSPACSPSVTPSASPLRSPSLNPFALTAIKSPASGMSPPHVPSSPSVCHASHSHRKRSWECASPESSFFDRLGPLAAVGPSPKRHNMAVSQENVSPHVASSLGCDGGCGLHSLPRSPSLRGTLFSSMPSLRNLAGDAVRQGNAEEGGTPRDDGAQGDEPSGPLTGTCHMTTAAASRPARPQLSGGAGELPPLAQSHTPQMFRQASRCALRLLNRIPSFTFAALGPRGPAQGGSLNPQRTASLTSASHHDGSPAKHANSSDRLMRALSGMSIAVEDCQQQPQQGWQDGSLLGREPQGDRLMDGSDEGSLMGSLKPKGPMFSSASSRGLSDSDGQLQDEGIGARKLSFGGTDSD